jgi:dienelactone hydrolase
MRCDRNLCAESGQTVLILGAGTLNMLRFLLLTVVVLTASLGSQSPYAAGQRDVGWPNLTGQGTTTLICRIHYPATAAGTDTPLLARAGGWPSVVFLHGFATSGPFYDNLGRAFAAAGFIAVVSNTSLFDDVGQELDGRALYHAVGAANVDSGSPFFGAFAPSQIGLAGHSMGGGNAANVLASNPGYRCGFGFAPKEARGYSARSVTVPFGMVVGETDAITPWQDNALLIYDDLRAYSDLKSLHLLAAPANHGNIVGLSLPAGSNDPSFDASFSIARGFFERFLSQGAAGLDTLLGPGTVADPRFTSIRAEIESPQTWTNGALTLGQTRRLSIAAEPGACGIVTGAFPLSSPVPTPFGDLLVDPSSLYMAFSGFASAGRRFDVPLAVPNLPGLAGFTLHAQCFGRARDHALVFGERIDLTFTQ